MITTPMLYNALPQHAIDLRDNLENNLQRWQRTAPKNTQAATKRALKSYLPLCEVAGLNAFPLTEASLLNFIDNRQLNNIKGATIAADIALLKLIDAFIHNMAISPLLETATLKLAIKEAKLEDQPPEQVTPLHYSDIVNWYQANEHRTKSLVFLRNNALFRLCYDGLLRVSEACAMNVSNLNATKNLFKIAQSKTDQEKKGAEQFMRDETITALRLYHEALSLKAHRDHKPSDPVFWSFRKYESPRDRLSIRASRDLIKQEFRNIEGVSGHSFRVGACQDLGYENFSLPMIMQAGRWKSPQMPAYYLRELAAQQGPMAQLAKRQSPSQAEINN